MPVNMMMVTRPTIFFKTVINCYPRLLLFSSIHSTTSAESIEQTIKDAVEAKTYQNIPDLLISLKETCGNRNPFSFLSTFPQNMRIQIIDEMLQSFIPVRPRSHPQLTYNHLLLYTLQSPHPLPLALAILQRMIHSGCLPIPQAHLLLSSAWLDHRHQSQSVSGILLEMQKIGYYPDAGTCNYIISSLCAIDQLDEAVKVLMSMSSIGCIPNLESYGAVISAMCTVRRTGDSVDLMKQMVEKAGLTPRQGTVVKVTAALRANREIWKAVEMIEFLERNGYTVGFESYELVVEGCLECHEYLLAGKVVMAMTEKGFIPYIRVRQKVIEGLAGVGEWTLACAVRQRLVELGS
ncbi:hypothetical protein SLE2022_212750 [Rubroshorea leprosula]